MFYIISVSSHDQSSSDDESFQVREQIVEDPHDGTRLRAQKNAQFEAKAERKAHRHAGDLTRAERKRREDQGEKKRKKAEAKQEAIEKRQYEEECQAWEEAERREKEYLKMKENENKGWLQEFVQYIKHYQVVPIKTLAKTFGMRTRLVINTIKELQDDDILPGAIDDCGQFIYVSPQQMHAVTDFIKTKGRVTIDELSEHSARLFKLSPVNKSR